MPTKIINVLQDDDFESILKIFNDTPAKEVIFVLPKSHEALGYEEHFATLAEASQEQEKDVLLLTSNPEVTAMALKYNLGILTSAKSDSRGLAKKRKNNLTVVKADKAQIIPEESLPEIEELEDETEPTSTQNRVMVDIVKPRAKEEEMVSVKISKKSEPAFKIEVKKDETPDVMEQIQSVWQSRTESEPVIRPRKPADFIKEPRISRRFSLFNLSRKTLTLLGSVAVILFFVILFVSTGSANIIIKPRAHDLDFSLKVITSDKFLTVDLERRNIPGQLFSVEKKMDQTFPATGERDVVQKAKGKIIVYNEYGTAPQVLIATTRFQSEGGLIFRTLKTITVPGTKVVNGEIIAGYIEVEVIADKAGEMYNIASGKFTIPAFKEKGDNDRYQKFYGLSREPMKGGIVGKAKVVTEQDYLKAKEIVSQQIISETEQELKNQASGLKILNLEQPSIKEISSTAQVDEAVNEFTISETAEVQTVGFKESDLHDLIAQYVENINALEVFPEKLKIEFSNIKFNREDKTLEFSTSVKGPAYSRIDKEKIISDLIGKNEDQIKDYIKNMEGVASAKVVLSPFWVQKVPTNKERVGFELQYE